MIELEHGIKEYAVHWIQAPKRGLVHIEWCDTRRKARARYLEILNTMDDVVMVQGLHNTTEENANGNTSKWLGGGLSYRYREDVLWDSRVEFPDGYVHVEPEPVVSEPDPQVELAIEVEKARVDEAEGVLSAAQMGALQKLLGI